MVKCNFYFYFTVDKDIDFEKSDNIDSLKNDIYVLENTENLPHLNEIQ